MEHLKDNLDVGDVIGTIIPQDEVIAKETSSKVKIALICMKAFGVFLLASLLLSLMVFIFIERGIVGKLTPVLRTLIEHLEASECDHHNGTLWHGFGSD